MGKVEMIRPMAIDGGSDMQAAIIGIILSYSQKTDIEPLFNKLPSEAFTQRLYRKSYEAAIKCHEQGLIPDIISVSDIVEQEIDSSTWGESTPVFAILSELAKNSSGPSNLMHYADNLLNHWRAFRALSILQDSVVNAQELNNPKEVLNHISETINKVTKYQEIAERSELLLSGSDGFDFNVDWLIKGWVPADSLGMIYGPSGSFKSFHVLDWAASISCGTEWSSNKVDGGAVLYIAGEGQAGVAKRIKAWEIVNKKSARNLYRVNRAMNLTDSTDKLVIINTCDRIKKETGQDVKLIVIDTVNRCFGDGDENSTQDMTSFVIGCDQIKAKTGASIMCVHHTGKDTAKGARGSSVLRAACDYEYSINRLAGVRGYQLACTKAKDFEVDGVNSINLSIVDLGVKDEEGRQKSSLARSGNVQHGNEGPKSSLEQLCVELLTESGGEVTRNWLNDQLLMSMDGDNEESNKAQIRRLLSKMKSNNVITVAAESVYLQSSLSIEPENLNRF